MINRVPHGRHLSRGPLEGAEAAFRRGARRLNKHPILGLGKQPLIIFCFT
jgi:hypothetical protein